MSSSLPNLIALFPLDGVILLPDGILPLNIFEPRYRQMVEDCLENHPYIGMIQPIESGSLELYQVGCLGVIENHRLLANGNYFIRLQGVTRFHIKHEISTDRLYRQAEVSYDAFHQDLEKKRDLLEKGPLYTAYKSYLEQRNLKIGWDKIQMIPLHHLVNLLSMNLEFTSSEKQTLLESEDLVTRWNDLIVLLKMASQAPMGMTVSSDIVN